MHTPPRHHPPAPARPAPLPPGGTTTLVLQPGDVAVGTRGDRFETLLGSCVAVVLADPRHTVGAMCHIVHAGDPAPGQADPTSHARPALIAMFEGLRRLGITPQLCEAQVYGGGNMFPALFRGHHVGLSNVQTVLALLAQAGIQVSAQATGGVGYRRLAWDVGPALPVCLHIEPAPAAP
jgi:chemotaxis protein CheD